MHTNISLHTVINAGSDTADTHTGMHIYTGKNTWKHAHTEANTDPSIHIQRQAAALPHRNAYTYIHTYIQNHTARQAGLDAYTQGYIHKQIYMHTYIQPYRQINTYIQKYRLPCRIAYIHTDRPTRHTETHIHIQGETLGG